MSLYRCETPKPGLVTFYTADMTPCDEMAGAPYAKLNADDGSVQWFTPAGPCSPPPGAPPECPRLPKRGVTHDDVRRYLEAVLDKEQLDQLGALLSAVSDVRPGHDSELVRWL